MLTTLLMMSTLLAAPAPRIQSPIPGTCITSGYGPRSGNLPRGASRNHLACDLRGGCGTGVRAAAGGVVEYAAPRGGYGNRIQIRHADGTRTTYSHLQRGSMAVRPGSRVTAGQQIGKVGATGLRGMACHLHFEVIKNGRKVNPTAMLGLARCGARGRGSRTFDR